jgi:hypothetical protein
LSAGWGRGDHGSTEELLPQAEVAIVDVAIAISIGTGAFFDIVMERVTPHLLA